jgi:hypothetical protein
MGQSAIRPEGSPPRRAAARSSAQQRTAAHSSAQTFACLRACLPGLAATRTLTLTLTLTVTWLQVCLRQRRSPSQRRHDGKQAPPSNPLVRRALLTPARY